MKLLLAVVVSLVISCLGQNAGQVGRWSPVYPAPLVPAAVANLPDGRIVYWSAMKKFNFKGKTGSTATAIFDPTTGISTERQVQNTQHDMFCPGTAMLHDGRIMITGGSDAKSVTVYNPKSNAWSKEAEMTTPRGYHSMTVLHDGSVFTVGGSWSGGRGGKHGELWNPDEERWIALNNITTTAMETNDKQGVYRSDNHMWLFESPDRRLFQAGPSKRMHWIQPRANNGQGSIVQSITRGNDQDAMNGNAVMYARGKILTVGGSHNYQSGKGSSAAHVIDINQGEATVKKVSDMQTGRTYCNSVVLPSGQVFVVGGQSKAKLFEDSNSVMTPELWTPRTGSFKTMAPHRIPRNYHSVAILLKDARVLIGGGGLCGDCSTNHADFEIFSPPYLFTADGQLANRPVIVSAPSEFRPGDTISVVTDSAGSESYYFVLTRLSAATHSVNNDQKRIDLKIESFDRRRGVFQLKTSKNTALLSPGDYYLFAVDEKGVPSVGKLVRAVKVSPFQPILKPARATNPVARSEDDSDSTPTTTTQCAQLRTNVIYHIASLANLRRGLTVGAGGIQDSLSLKSLDPDHRRDDWQLRLAPNADVEQYFYRMISMRNQQVLYNSSHTLKVDPSDPRRDIDWCFSPTQEAKVYQIRSRVHGTFLRGRAASKEVRLGSDSGVAPSELLWKLRTLRFA